ncbi:methionine ABC transporter substrate-binding protein [Oceanobacillus piezotolerans]|uniref:Lipoprotein n=1 Tax=Oceanobacillus piezotolerans TaxID=2448030 RepID=A0A498DCZ3_9BACI|nr:MetQ/NlpA family ABC transporter substrate-binding protein [Oceanobacillus piezotolerans]RLL46530.1 methionine ABC transporter substrate-binding protein [Oceanobacillus piezotolerans]
MKKILSLFAILFIALVLAACGNGGTEEGNTDNAAEGSNEEGAEESSNEPAEIVVGASSTPHAEILKEAQPILEEEGITLKIEEYQDYILPNDDLANGTLDANYFQTVPYLELTVSDTGYDLDYIEGIHIEPLGIYSKNITSVDDIPENTEVIISRSISDHARILALFEAEGLIKLDESVEKSAATVDDITENPLNLTFSPDVDAAFLPEMYESEEDALVAINGNYAIEAGLSPLDDALFHDGDNPNYENVVAVRSEDKDNEALNKLVEVLQSEEIQNFILENYGGAVVPVGGDK